MEHPPDFFGDNLEKMSNSAISQNYVIFARKITQSPDSRQNLQFLREFCFSPETGLLRVRIVTRLVIEIQSLLVCLVTRIVP